MKPSPQISIVVSSIQLLRRSFSRHRFRPPPADRSVDGMLIRLSKQYPLPFLAKSYQAEDCESEVMREILVGGDRNERDDR